jgi:hypothetical protein
MVRILFTMMFWVVVGRYCYAELKLLAPSATPYIDQVLATIQIPTHDQWDPVLVGAISSGIRDQGERLMAKSGTLAVKAIGNIPQHPAYENSDLQSVIVRAVSATRGSGIERF